MIPGQFPLCCGTRCILCPTLEQMVTIYLEQTVHSTYVSPLKSRKVTAEKCVTLSTMCSTKFPSKNVKSIDNCLEMLDHVHQEL